MDYTTSKRWKKTLEKSRKNGTPVRERPAAKVQKKQTKR